MITFIAALDRRGAIGRLNQLLWSLPRDMAHFKAYTTGKPVLMGYETALSVGRALPKRLNLVLTACREAPYPGQMALRSLQEVLAFHRVHGDEEIVVCGGGKVYATLLPYADRLILTHVEDTVPDADAFFPWEEVRQGPWKADVARDVVQEVDGKHDKAFVIRTYDRVLPSD